METVCKNGKKWKQWWWWWPLASTPK